MTKRKRLHYKNAKYHIMLRGNYRQAIFTEDFDYLKMYDIMEDITQKYRCNFLMFCLMTNHTHMIVEVTDIPLSKIMQSLGSRYSRYFNKKMKVVGHLFQGRYLAKPIMNEKYLLELCYYIHNNPRAAKMCVELDSYRWSSHRHYRQIDAIDWLLSDEIVKFLQKQFNSTDYYYDLLFSSHQKNAEDSVCDFDADGALIISSEPIIDRAIEQPIDLRCFSIQEITKHICEHIGISSETVSDIDLSQKVVLARALIAYFSHYHAGCQLKNIANTFNQQPDSVSLNLHKMLKRQGQTKIRDELYQRFIQILKSREAVSDT